MPSAHANPLLEVPLLPGVRQDVDPHVAPIGTLTEAKNVRFGRLGVVRPRPGTRRVLASTRGNSYQLNAQPTKAGFAGTRGAAALLGIDGKVLAWNGDGLFTFAGTYSTAQPRQRRNGLVTEVNGGFATLGHRCAIATIGDTVLIAGSDTVNVHWRVETFAGTVLAKGFRAGTVCSAVTGGADKYYLIIQNGTDLSALPITVTPSSASEGVFTSVATLTTSLSPWDATSYDVSNWFLVYRSATATVNVRRMSAVTATHTVAVTHSFAGTVHLSVWGDTANARVWVGVYDNALVTGDVAYAVHTAATAAVDLAYQSITTGPELGPPLFGAHGTDDTAFFVYRESLTSSPYTTATHGGTASTVGAVELAVASAQNVLPLTKPDPNHRAWCKIADNTVESPDYDLGLGFRTTRVVLLRWWGADATDPLLLTQTPVLELATEQAENRSTGSGQADEFHAIATAADRHFVITPRLIRSGRGLLFRGDVLEYETADQAPHRAFQDLVQSGLVTGQPIELFGDSTPIIDTGESPMAGGAEVGFAYEPAVLAAAPANGTGALTSSATYRWLFIFEWLDFYGRRHRSAASRVIAIPLGATDNEVAFTLSPLDWSQRLAHLPSSNYPSVVLHAYRTQADRGLPYKRATPSSGAPLAFAPSGTVTWTDRVSDATLASQEIAYTDGGVLDNVLAPSARYVAANDERTLLGGLWDSCVVQFSKIRVTGEPEQYADSDTFRQFLRGPCTGVAYQDGSWLAFTATAISVITGDGPDDQGNGSFFTRTIATDRGCIDGRSVLETALGVIYRSRRGFELIPRGNGLPMFVGKEVQVLTRQYPQVLGAAHHVSDYERTALFLLSDGSNQVVLALDLDLTQELGRGVWSHDAHTVLGAGLQAIGPWPIGTFLAAANIDEANNLAGCLYDETPTHGSDLSNTATLESAVALAPLRPAGLVGVWRCCTVNTVFTDCDGGAAALTLATDGAPMTIGSWTLPASAYPVYRTAAPQTVVCTSATLRFSVTRTGAVVGPNMHGFTIERQPVDGARRTSSGER